MLDCYRRARLDMVGRLRRGKRNTVVCVFAAGRLRADDGLFLTASAKRLRSFAAAFAIGSLGARCLSSASL